MLMKAVLIKACYPTQRVYYLLPVMGFRARPNNRDVILSSYPGRHSGLTELIDVSFGWTSLGNISV